MANRPVFVPTPQKGLVDEKIVSFEWFPGFALVQKQRSIKSFHESICSDLGISRVLEISTKSMQPLGVRLSAFNLHVDLSGSEDRILLEAAFQGSKVFEKRGPFTHLYSMRSGRNIKHFMKRLSADDLTGFQFEGRDWGLTPKTAFYDWLYIRSLRDLAERDDTVSESLSEFDAFTDIEFNPVKSVNCQARSCALYVALQKNGKLCDVSTDPTAFLSMLEYHGYGI